MSGELILRYIAGMILVLTGCVGLVNPALLINLRHRMGPLRHLDLMEPVYKTKFGSPVMRVIGMFFLLGGVLLLFG